MDLVTSLKRLRRGALIAIQIVACGPSADPVTSVGTLVHECPVANSPTEPRALPLAPTHRAFGFGPDGQLLEFDTNTGRVVATAPTPPNGIETIGLTGPGVCLVESGVP